jgi:hypothetical protein
MAAFSVRNAFAALFDQPRSKRRVLTSRRTMRATSRPGVERLEPRQVMAGTTIGDSLPVTGGSVTPAIVAPPSGGGSGSQPPTSPSGPADYTVLTSVWGMGKNAPKLFENDDFMVKVSFVSASGPVYPRPVTVGVWADLNFNKQPDPGEEYNTTTVVPQGFVQARFKAFDDGPWPGNGTPLDTIPIVVTVSDRGVVRQVNTGATVYNVVPMFAKPPEYKPGVDSSGRNYIDVTATFWDPGNRDLFDLRLVSGRTNLTSSRMAPQPQGDEVLKLIQHRFYVPSATSLGEVATLTISDDDSGKDTRWNQWQTVGLNNDDDDHNGIVDMRDRGLVNDDPDVVKLGGLRAVQPGWLLPQMRRPDGELVLFYDPKVVRLWDSPKKGRLFAPYEGLQGEVGSRFLGSETLYVEGVGFGSTEIYATWTPNKPGFFVNEKMNRTVSHSFTINVTGVDVDIDSDNDEGVKTNFERDEWNEYLEDSPYALGKFVGNSADSSYVPFTVQLGYVSDSAYSDLGLRFRYDQTLFTVWAYNKDQLLNGPNQILGSDGTYRLGQLGARSNGRLTFWIQSNKEGDQTQIRKYVDDVAAGLVSQLRVDLIGVRGLNNPAISSDSVKVRSIFHNNHDPIDIKDAYGEYPMALQADPALRAMGAANLVYQDGTDSKKYALKELSRDELKKLFLQDPRLARQDGIDGLINSLTETLPDGFRARMYLDHCDTVNGRYVIAFEGTVFTDLRDIVTNLAHTLDGGSAQYTQALNIGSVLAGAAGGVVTVGGSRPFHLAGHSLGGGLASAAAYASGIHATTFNAAGVNPGIFYSGAMSSDYPPTFPEALNRWRTSNRGQGLITGYVVGLYDTEFASDYRRDAMDMLHWFQSCGASWTHAVRTYTADGDQKSVEGLCTFTKLAWVRDEAVYVEEVQAFWRMTVDLEEAFQTAADWTDLVGKVNWLLTVKWSLLGRGLPLVGTSEQSVLSKATSSHYLASIAYGLLHDDAAGWNAYDRGGDRESGERDGG